MPTALEGNWPIRHPILAAAIVAALALPAGWASAGGFHSPYQSTTAIGTAFAGATARADDAGFFFFNPSSISSLDGRQTFIDARGFIPNVRIEPSGASSPLGASTLADGQSGNLARNALAPGSTTVAPLAPGLMLGLGTSAHFATDAETSGFWAGRYHLVKSYMVGLNATGALSWQATPWLAVAAGIQVQYMDNRFENTVAIPIGPGAPVEAAAYLKASSWAAGAVAGITLTPREGTRIGISWRPPMTHHMKGRTGARIAGIAVEKVSYDLDLPATASLGLEQRLGRDWRLFAEWQWAGWSRFKGFDFSFASGRPDEHRPIDWQDTWLASLGLGYRLTEATEITLGLALDKGASRTGSGTTLSPDSDKVIAGIGLVHDAAGLGRFSLSYGRVVLDEGIVHANSAASGTLDGKLVGRMDMLGIGYTHRW